MLAMFALAAAGCSGVHQSGSVSPATFFLPGILKAEPQKNNAPDLTPEPAKEFASVK